MFRESVWCIGLAQSACQKRSDECHQSKFSDGFHMDVLFYEGALRPHRLKPRYQPKPSEKLSGRDPRAAWPLFLSVTGRLLEMAIFSYSS